MRLVNKTVFDNSLFEKLLGAGMLIIGGLFLTLLFNDINFSYIFAVILFFISGIILEWQSKQSSRDEHANDMGMISPRANF